MQEEIEFEICLAMRFLEYLGGDTFNKDYQTKLLRDKVSVRSLVFYLSKPKIFVQKIFLRRIKDIFEKYNTDN